MARGQELRKFLDVYRNLPELWDTSNKNYHSRQRKIDAYAVLVEAMKKWDPRATRASAVKKINCLRSNFRKEFRKTRRIEGYTPKLWYFNDLKFLVDKKAVFSDTTENNENSKKTNLNICRESIDDESISTDGVEAENKPMEDENDEDTMLTDTKLVNPPKIAENDRVLDMAEDLCNLAARHLNRNEDNQFTLMGKLYAEKLKNMTGHQALFADRIINEVLFEGQMGNLTRNTSFHL